MTLHGRNLIAGELSSEGGEGRRAENPATGASMDPLFMGATSAELNRALGAAREAAEVFRGKGGEDRSALLKGIADEILKLGDELIERCSAETGLTASRLVSERARTCAQLGAFAGLVEEGSWVEARIDTPLPDRKPVPKPDVRRMLVPIGPVAVFCAGNFPLAFSVAGGDTASALAAGNPVVVKAHHSHPGTAELVGAAISRAIEKLGMPPGLFSLLHGPGRKVGIDLVTHPVTRAVGFTGSQSGGRALFDAAAGRPDPIPVYAEMGSINPVFILPQALKQRYREIALGLKNSVTLGAGQFCTNPGLVAALAAPELDDFLAELRELFLESPPETMLNTEIRSAYEDGVERLRKSSGVSIAGESRSRPDKSMNQATAAVFTTDAETFLHHTELGREVFGPSTLLVTARSREELLRIAREMEGHLTATVHGTDAELGEYGDLVDVLGEKVGRLIFNGFPTGVEVCPSMHHGGPYPAATDVHFTSVGTAAIYRFSRPLCYQGFPDSFLPPELRDANPLDIRRTLDGSMTRDPVRGL